VPASEHAAERHAEVCCRGRWYRRGTLAAGGGTGAIGTGAGAGTAGCGGDATRASTVGFDRDRDQQCGGLCQRAAVEIGERALRPLACSVDDQRESIRVVRIAFNPRRCLQAAGSARVATENWATVL